MKIPPTFAYLCLISLVALVSALDKRQLVELRRSEPETSTLVGDKSNQESTQTSFLGRLLLRPPLAPFNETATMKSIGAAEAAMTPVNDNQLNSGEQEAGDDDDDYYEEEGDEEGDDEDDDEDENEGEEAQKENAERAVDEVKFVTDIFGNKMKLDNNRTILVAQNKARDLGLLTIKAILLGPLIGLTIKAALIRGLFWAVGAYFLHLFFPGLLGALGLGTGLVGFARQLQPDYAQMLMPHLMDLQNSLPGPLMRMISQYKQVFQPVIEAIRSIPEGHCRFRAVCETANYLVRNTRFMSNTLQRLSATVYLNFGTEYSKAWLDGVVQSDCAVKYAQCTSSPFSTIANRVGEALRRIN